MVKFLVGRVKTVPRQFKPANGNAAVFMKTNAMQTPKVERMREKREKRQPRERKRKYVRFEFQHNDTTNEVPKGIRAENDFRRRVIITNSAKFEKRKRQLFNAYTT